MKLKRPIVFFDLETTGADVTKDRIVEVAALKVHPDGKKELVCRQVNPLIPIHPDATAVHGITNEMVRDKPTFKQIAKSFREFLSGCDLGGFNSDRFDIPLLVEEFARVECPLDLTGISFVDVYRIFVKNEERTLSAAYKFYTGKELENAHAADSDILATYEVLEAQIERYGLPEDLHELVSTYTDESKRVDFSGKFIRDDSGVIVFNFGKHKGKSVCAVVKADPSYYSWMMNGEFTNDTKNWLTRICQQNL